ncbi:MAG: EF-hand domain-containing protein [Cyanobacteria bacterium J06559_3]
MLTELQSRKLLKLFCMYDGDRNGFLVQQDFEQVVERLAKAKNLGARSPKVLALKERFRRVWQSLLAKADASGDQKVCLNEWMAYYVDVLGDEEKYAQEVHDLMKLIFDVFDTNGDGKLSQEEWAELFQVYNIHPAYAPSAFEQLDENQDGVLSQTEILVLVDDFFCGDTADSVANSMFGPY